MTLPKALQIKPFLTVIPSRRPVQKLHTTIGHAKNAINNKESYYNRKYFFRGEEIPDSAKWQMTWDERKEIVEASPLPEDMQLWVWQDEEWILMYDIKAGDFAPWKKVGK